MQTPAPFEYERATSVEGAIASLVEHDGDARIIAGGHSLLPMMKLRLAAPEHLIDINDLHELVVHPRGGRRDPDRRADASRGAAGAPSCSLERSPVFADAEEVIADPVVRNRGTIGGSLCQADAAEDLSAVCAALRASVVIRGPEGERVVGIDEFYIGPFTTAVGADEMLTEVRIPRRPNGGSAHEKVERRAGDLAIAAVSAAVWIDGGVIAEAGLALSAVGAITIQATRAASCCGARPRPRSCSRRRARSPSEDCSPQPDGRGTVDYKRHLAGVLSKRALRRATARALHTGGLEPMQVTIKINGEQVSRDVEPRMLLVHFIRETPGLTGTHWGCDTSNCGACVVLMDGKPVKSCTILAAMVEGHEVRTVESLEVDGSWTRSSRAFTRSTRCTAAFARRGC